MRARFGFLRRLAVVVLLLGGTAVAGLCAAPGAAFAKEGESGGSGGGGSGGSGSSDGGGRGSDDGGRGRGSDDGGRNNDDGRGAGDGRGDVRRGEARESRDGRDGRDRRDGRDGGVGSFLGSLFGGRADESRQGTRERERERGEDRQGRGRGRGDQDVARDAVARGQAVPFSRVVDTVRRTMPGDILDVKVDRSATGLTYNVTVLAKDGWYREVVVDAQRNRVLQVR